MKITRRQLRRIIKETLDSGLPPVPPLPQSQAFLEWTAWGEGYDLDPEFDNEGQLMFYLDGDSQHEEIEEARKKGAQIEVPGAYGGYGQQDDATVVIYTDAYDSTWVEEEY